MKGGFLEGYAITFRQIIASQKWSFWNLIALGAIMGKINTFQLFIFTLVSVIFFALN